MSISINEENFKRFSKRLKKNLNSEDKTYSLAQCQELLARTLGVSSYHELMTILKRNNKPDRASEAIVDDDLFVYFLQKLQEISLKSPDISKVYFGIDKTGYYNDLYISDSKCDSFVINLAVYRKDIFLKNIHKINVDDATKNELLELFELFKSDKLNGLFTSNILRNACESKVIDDFIFIKYEVAVNEISVSAGDLIYKRRFALVNQDFFDKHPAPFYQEDSRFCYSEDIIRCAGWESEKTAFEMLQKDHREKILIEYYVPTHHDKKYGLISSISVISNGKISTSKFA